MPDLGFEPRTRADSRRWLALLLLAVIWLGGLVVVELVILHSDAIRSALLFTTASFLVAVLWLSLTVLLRRRRASQPGPEAER